VLLSNSSDETSGDRQALIAAFMQALKSFVERLSRAEGHAKPDAGQEDEENPLS
jgi:hypothetical protein